MTTINMFGMFRYVGASGFKNEVPVQQSIEGLDVSTLGVSLIAGETLDQEFPTAAAEITYLHVYADSTITLELFDADEVVIASMAVKGHTLLSLTPGAGYAPHVRLTNNSSSRSANVVLTYGSLPDNGTVPTFYAD